MQLSKVLVTYVGNKYRGRKRTTFKCLSYKAGVAELRGVLNGLKKKAGDVAERIKQLEVFF